MKSSTGTIMITAKNETQSPDPIHERNVITIRYEINPQSFRGFSVPTSSLLVTTNTTIVVRAAIALGR